MSDRVADLEAKVAEISESLRQMERRVGALEHALPPALARRVRGAAAAAAQPAGDAAAAMLRHDAASVVGTISLAGRTLLVLAGAFLLRALTDSGRLPVWIGVGMGFVYAGIWVAAADRAAGARRLASAGFHGAAAVAIGFPLLYETTARFKLFPTWLAAGLLSAFTAVALAVAARRRFEPLGWLVVLAAIPAAYALMLAQGRVAPPLLFLVLLGAATVWLGYVLDWHALRWPVAGAADLGVLFLAVEAVRPTSPDGPLVAVLVQFALIAAYLGSTAVRTLGLRRSVVAFEMVQAPAAVVAGLGGAAFVAAHAGMGAGALGVLSLAFGVAAYAVAFAFVERERTPANFYFYASAGLAFVVAGAAFLLGGGARALFWAALAVTGALLSRTAGRLTLAAHAAAYGVAAALASGLLSHAVDALFASPGPARTSASVAEVAVAAALAVAAWAVRSAPARSFLEHAPRVVLLAALAAAVAGLAVGWIAPAVAGAPGAGADSAIVATVRTAILAVGALALAGVGRLETWSDARWLAWPVLALGGVKLSVQVLDAASRPATLFLAFALYGAALILVPRLRRRGASPARERDAGTGRASAGVPLGRGRPGR
jgi:hypothetical protein